MIKAYASGNTIKSIAIKLLFGTIALSLLVILIINRQNRMLINQLVSKCDRIAIVHLDEILLKNNIYKNKKPSIESIKNATEQYKNTDSSILLKYKLTSVDYRLMLVDEHGEIVAIVTEGQRDRLRGVGDLENIGK